MDLGLLTLDILLYLICILVLYFTIFGNLYSTKLLRGTHRKLLILLLGCFLVRVADKMVQIEWYRQNGSNFWNRLQFKWIQYLFSKQKSQISDKHARKPKVIKVEVGLMIKSYCQWEQDWDWLMILSPPFYSYHFVCTMLSNSVFSVPFCPLPFYPRTVS